MALLAGLVIVILVAAGILAQHFWQIGRTIGPSCGVGIAGTAASVTVQGWTAPFACQAITNQLAGTTHGLSAAVLVPRPADAASAPAVCQTVVAHDRVTVSDGDALPLVGKLLCAVLAHGT
jgi:hypothetical protein